MSIPVIFFVHKMLSCSMSKGHSYKDPIMPIHDCTTPGAQHWHRSLRALGYRNAVKQEYSTKIASSTTTKKGNI